MNEREESAGVNSREDRCDGQASCGRQSIMKEKRGINSREDVRRGRQAYGRQLQGRFQERGGGERDRERQKAEEERQ